MKNTPSLIWQSILENGHIIDGKHTIGQVVRTQWGMRRVVSVQLVQHDVTPDSISQAEIAQRVQ